MEKRIKYPVGIQTFSEIIAGNYLYVDKTELVYELANNSKYVFLSRPRRFGKSLLMSTLASYFKGQRELFKGLAIEDLETEWTEYPVFRFDLSGENYINVERLKIRLTRCLKEIAEDYSLVCEGETPADIFIGLIGQAKRKYGTRVVILIDEYDKPMLDSMHDDDLMELLRAELRAFYSVMKQSDEYIRFAMLTGVTKFGKVSVFSGLNNLKDISLLPDYNAICGISESELRRDFVPSAKTFAAANGITEEETWQEIKRMYDGYHFANTC